MLVIGGVVLLVLIAGAVWYSQSKTSVKQENTQVTTEPVTPQESPATDSAQSVNVKAFNLQNKALSFDVKEIKVKKGDTVKVTFKVTQGTHDFVVEEFSTRTELLKVGQEETVEFIADKTGSFEYYCSVPGHREAGMKGTLIVE